MGKQVSLLALLIFNVLGQEQPYGFHGYAQKFGDLVYDFMLINRYFFSRSTLRVFTGYAPFYIGSRAIDTELHKCFYDEITHTNKEEPPRYCNHFIEEQGGIIPVALLSSFWLWAPNERLRMVSRTYLLGAASLFLMKNLIKNTFEFECAARPFNEHFPKKRVFGGFPSGHAAIFTYSALYWGLEYGPKAFIPLAIYGITGNMLLLNCNRHFVSQIVAGMALGTAYALAAHKVAQWHWPKNIDITFENDHRGRVMAGVTYSF